MSSIETISVSNFMTRDVKTEKEDENVVTACRIMRENDIGSINGLVLHSLLATVHGFILTVGTAVA